MQQVKDMFSANVISYMYVTKFDGFHLSLTVKQATRYLAELFQTEVKISKLRSAIRTRKLKTSLHASTGWYLISPENAINWFKSTKDGEMHYCKKGVMKQCQIELKWSK